MKRIVSIILALTLICCMIPTAFAASSEGLNNFKAVNTYTQGQFLDVTADYWGSANIQKAYELGLMNGNGGTTFNPAGDVSIAQAITMAARLNSIYYTGSENFVQGDVWYQAYVDYAKKNGIPADYTNYNAAATRAQFASILAAALPSEALAAINTVENRSIPDVDINNTDAQAIYELYRAGILTGNDDKGTFTPNSSISRAAAAAIITRMADTSLRKSITLKVEKLKLVDLGKLNSGRVDIVKYEGKQYTFYEEYVDYAGKTGGSNVLYSAKENEIYDLSLLDLIFGEYYTDLPNDNPYVDGAFTPYMNYFNDQWLNLRRYKNSITVENTSATTTLRVNTITYFDKVFEGITAERFIAAGLEDGSTGTWDGVRFVVSTSGSNSYVYYNLNDVASYFGINRKFSVEKTENPGNFYLVIEE
jgi:hypothetical protein